MELDDATIKDLLVREKYVAAADIAKAEAFAKEHDVAITEYLITAGILTKDLLGQAVAEALRVPYADLNSNQPAKDQVLKIAEDIAKKYDAVLFAEDKIGATIATDNPAQESLADEMQKLFPGKQITIAYALPEDIAAAFIHYRKPLETRFSKIIAEQKRIAPEILEEIFGDALTFRASDIHFEPQLKDTVAVRFRVDGVLEDAGRIPREHYQNILNRIKVESRLRIDEHFAAQDGSMRYEKDGKIVDLRTSVIPTVEGEKVVLRVLAAYVEGFALADLGLAPRDEQLLAAASKKPFGMILVTGPTGSGKTTTLYALLRILNRPDVNITTIEDPVEYKIVGVNQIQVNPQTNLTFAQGLRSIVRQDPDIILVGEIRDDETAEIAVNAALTGHLLLSTFHANDAATAIPRLLDMRIEPFLLASTLEVVIAQRLVRKICDHCKVSASLAQKDIARRYPAAAPYFTEKTITLYAGKGCDACSHTGYHGRTAVFEFIRATPELRELMLTHPSTPQVWRLARKEGTRSLFEDGVEKAKSGITSLEELLRVASPPLNHDH